MGACFSRWVVKAFQFCTTMAFLRAKWDLKSAIVDLIEEWA